MQKHFFAIIFVAETKPYIMKKLIYQFIFTAIATLAFSCGYAQQSGPPTIVTESIEIFNQTKIAYKLIGKVKTPKDGYINAEDKYIVTYQLVFRSQDATSLSNVVIRDKLPRAIDANSVQVKTSYNSYGLFILKGNELEFNFERIDLPKGETIILEFELQVDPIIKVNSILNEVAIYIDNELSGRVNEEVYWLGERYMQATAPSMTSEKAHIYPNPTIHNIHIKNVDSGYLILMNQSGKQLLYRPIEGEQTLDLSNYLNGIYTLQIVQEGKVETHQIIKLQ